MYFLMVIYSPAMSFKGWSIKNWFYGNGRTIKEVIKVALPIGISWLATRNPVYTVIATGIGKLILDSLEYFVKEKGTAPELPTLEAPTRPFAGHVEAEPEVLTEFEFETYN